MPKKEEKKANGPLSLLPKEILFLVMTHLSSSDLLNLARTAHWMLLIFNDYKKQIPLCLFFDLYRLYGIKQPNIDKDFFHWMTWFLDVRQSINAIEPSDYREKHDTVFHYRLLLVHLILFGEKELRKKCPDEPTAITTLQAKLEKTCSFLLEHSDLLHFTPAPSVKVSNSTTKNYLNRLAFHLEELSKKECKNILDSLSLKKDNPLESDRDYLFFLLLGAVTKFSLPVWEKRTLKTFFQDPVETRFVDAAIPFDLLQMKKSYLTAFDFGPIALHWLRQSDLDCDAILQQTSVLDKVAAIFFQASCRQQTISAAEKKRLVEYKVVASTNKIPFFSKETTSPCLAVGCAGFGIWGLGIFGSILIGGGGGIALAVFAVITGGIFVGIPTGYFYYRHQSSIQHRTWIEQLEAGVRSETFVDKLDHFSL